MPCSGLERTFSAWGPPMQYQRAEFLCLMQYRWAEFLCLMQCHRSTVVCTCREFQLEFLQYLRQLPQGSLIGKKVKGGERQNEMFWAQTWDSFDIIIDYEQLKWCITQDWLAGKKNFNPSKRRGGIIHKRGRGDAGRVRWNRNEFKLWITPHVFWQ